MASARYCLREKAKKDYREVQVPLPRPERAASNSDKLYPIEVIDEDGDRVKIHYIGYGDGWDEWRSREDVVDMAKAKQDTRTRQLETYTPYNPHQELAHAIKAALTPSRKFGGPEVRIELPFDLLVFQGGLKVLGTYIKTFRGNDLYGINEYGDLVPLLGSRWHVRGINRHLDFCAVEKCSVVFHIFKKSSIEDYISEEKTELVPGGYTLVFKFVRFDGVRRQLHKFT